MEARISVLILATTTIVNCLPPPHPEVVAVRQAEALLPPHLKSPALRNPHLLHTLELTSLLHSGEKLVYDREADHVPRREIYDILTHAGFIGRKKHINQSPPKHLNHAKTYHQSYDSSFIFDSDIAQYL
ncbi:uncharacterized protein LOC123656404 [Melitaea cinxia]|uniref:uncharacterized protein LOC123656404 n=1 Tax=Melitaea cinxia TaxID=113334 RepID=UPI001E2730FE|nr:uncharacterized protein LOC123656404 [Melitaea cinxia]